MRADAMNAFFPTTPATFGRILRATVALGVLSAVTACSSPAKESDSSSYLAIDSLTAARGGSTDGEFQSTLQSDVRTFGTQFSDPMMVTMRVTMKDPSFSTSPTNYITVTRYQVRLINSAGSQVGQTFEGASTFTVSGTTIPSQMTLIPAQAKLQSPFKELAQTAETLPLRADVTFFGADQTGKAVSVSGSILTNFGDWPDPGTPDTAGVASFVTSGSLRVGQQVVFDASASTAAPGRTIAKYSWDFGDGSPIVENTFPFATHTFLSSSLVPVTLTITDSAGFKYSIQKVLNILP